MVVCEGHIRRPEHVPQAFRRGAFSVVVGTAITDPLEITTWFTRDSLSMPSTPGKHDTA
jgi:N-acylglucosamine-6-phosphate 2-epimerase